MSALITAVDDKRYMVMWTEVFAFLIASTSVCPLSLGSTRIEMPVLAGGGGPASAFGPPSTWVVESAPASLAPGSPTLGSVPVPLRFGIAEPPHATRAA